MGKGTYFCGAIRGGDREDVELYQDIIGHLQTYDEVLTTHIANKNLALMGEDGLSDPEICRRDRNWLRKSKRVVAEVTTPSLGIGFEIGTMVERNENVGESERKPILCLYRSSQDKRLSAMINGCDGVTVCEYQTLDEAKSVIDEWIKPSL